MNSRLNSARKNIFSAYICKFVGLILPFILRMVTLATIGAEYLGLNGLFQAVFSFLSIADLGMASAITYMMYKPFAEDDTDTICALLNAYRHVYRIVGCVTLGAGLCVIPFLPQLVHGETPEGIRLTTVYLIMLVNSSLGYFFFAYRDSLFNASQRVDVLNYIDLGVRILTTVLQILLLLLFRNYYLYCIVIPTITLVRNLALYYLSRRMYPQYECRGHITAEQKASLKKQVSGLLIGNISGKLTYDLDTIVISTALGLVLLAKYQNYMIITSNVAILAEMLDTSLIPGIGNSLVTESVEKNHRYMNVYQYLYMWLNGWFMACLVCMYQPFIQLWLGKEMMLSDAIVPLFGLYFITRRLNNVCWQFRAAAGLWWEDRYRSVFAGVFNLAMDLLLVRILGAAGALIGTIIYQVVFDSPWGTRILFKNRFPGQKPSAYVGRNYIYLVTASLGCAICWFVCKLIPIPADRNLAAVGFLVLRGLVCTLAANGFLWLIYHRLPEYEDAKGLVKRLLRPEREVTE